MVDHGYVRRGVEAAGRAPPVPRARSASPSSILFFSRRFLVVCPPAPRFAAGPQAHAVEPSAHSLRRQVLPPNGPCARLRMSSSAFERLSGPPCFAILRLCIRERPPRSPGRRLRLTER